VLLMAVLGPLAARYVEPLAKAAIRRPAVAPQV
jgi:monovalent cation:H+ antiporter-2, CPA2 family